MSCVCSLCVHRGAPPQQHVTALSVIKETRAYPCLLFSTPVLYMATWLTTGSSPPAGPLPPRHPHLHLLSPQCYEIITSTASAGVMCEQAGARHLWIGSAPH